MKELRLAALFVVLASLVACSPTGGGQEQDAGGGGGVEDGGGGSGGNDAGSADGGGGNADAGGDQKPTVLFTAPLDGQTVNGIVILRATASDDVGIKKVDFLVSGQPVGTATSAPYQASWATGALINGNYFLTARATDTADQTAEASIQVFVANFTGSNEAPSVRLIYPVGGSKVCGSISIEAAATDDVGVAQVEFFLDGQTLGVDTSSAYQKAWGTAGAANGPHVLRAVATDSDGLKGQHTIQLRVDNTSGATCDNLPSVSLTQPARKYLSGATVAVAANASDDVGVVKVQFFVDNGLIAEDNTVPYSASWATAGFAEGPHTLKAVAYDTASQLGQDVVQMTLDTKAPSVSITSPAANAVVGDSFAVTINAMDSYGVEKVELRVDGTLAGAATAAPYTVNVTGAASGSRALRATAYDRAGNSGQSSAVNVMVDKPPSVSITAPASGAAVRGKVTVAATASDDVGVAKVEFFLDVASLSVVSSAPYTFSWDTHSTPKGSYILKAVATDTKGQTSSHQVTVTVSDAAPTVSITSPASGVSVSGSVTIIANASDDVGIASVTFEAGGTALGIDTTTPYEATWNTCPLANGTVTLEAIATDTRGQTAAASRQVTLANASAPPVLSGTPGNGTATLSWTFCGAGASGFNLYWAASPGVTTGSNLLAFVTSPYVHAARTNGQSYYYRVAALAGDSPGPLSNEVNVTPRAPVGFCSSGKWCWENPLPQGNSLTAVWGSSANDVWAVGHSGAIIRYRP
jgi:hypothetical protein